MNNIYPVSVQKTIDFVKSSDIWFSVTQNLNNGAAMSCADAAHKRNRLGGQNGIPLCDELKSNIGYCSIGQERKYYLLHCRGNQKIDQQKINALLGANFQRLENEELKAIFNCEYGLVNPFLFDAYFPEVEQIFDNSLLEEYSPPYTIMTNAGDKLWGIEIKANELVTVVKNKRSSDIITNDSKIKIKKHKIGILTGNSPESGIFLWQKINEVIRARLDNDFLGDLSFPAVLVKSIPEMGLSMELDNRKNETWKFVKEGIVSLCKNGATIIGIACNTIQFFSKEINEMCKEYGTDYFSMYDAVNSFLIAEKINHFDFLGIKYVTDFSKWSDFKKLKDNYHVAIPSEKDLERISRIAFEVKQKVVTPKGINDLRDVIKNSTKTKNIIIALTEISILLATQKQRRDDDKRYIDTLSLLAHKIADRYLEDHSKMLGLNKRVLNENELFIS